jgi:hypothetical protein
MQYAHKQWVSFLLQVLARLIGEHLHKGLFFRQIKHFGNEAKMTIDMDVARRSLDVNQAD